MPGSTPIVTRDGEIVYGGEQERLCDSAGGWLLLSTLAPQRRDGLLRRLNAEADSDHHFDHSVVREQVEDCGRLGFAIGPMGFGTKAQMCMMLLPITEDERPLAIGFAYDGAERTDSESLTMLLKRSVERCFNPSQRDGAVLQLVSDAA
jgi:hypothetical protein